MAGGRGGGRGGRDKREMPRSVQVSKKLSWLLRHGASSEKLALNSGAYANVADVLQNRNLRSLKVTFDEIREAVADNDKQRYHMMPVSEATPADSTDPKDFLIRANQGHSIKLVDAEALLEPITAANTPAVAVHGTRHSAWPLIVASGGLKPMGRNHVHFAPGLPASFTSAAATAAATAAAGEVDEEKAPAVVSGMRNSSTVLMYLDVEKALKEGLKLWISANGVILSEGNADGIVPLSLFSKVEDRTGAVEGGVLLQDGIIVKDPPAAWTKGGNKK